MAGISNQQNDPLFVYFYLNQPQDHLASAITAKYVIFSNLLSETPNKRIN
jgi:hypothetical protein